VTSTRIGRDETSCKELSGTGEAAKRGRDDSSRADPASASRARGADLAWVRSLPHRYIRIGDAGAGSSRFSRDSKISVDTHIEAVRAVVDALGLESVIAVGHDSGGPIARHAPAADLRLAGMILFNTEQSPGPTPAFKRFTSASKLPFFEHILGWAANTSAFAEGHTCSGDASATQHSWTATSRTPSSRPSRQLSCSRTKSAPRPRRCSRCCRR